MPDEIDLGDGVTAEFIASVSGGDFYLNDPSLDEAMCLTINQARKFCRFVEEKAGKGQP